MIVGPNWIWLHVPKCAGTTTESILHEAFGTNPRIIFDEIGTKLPVIWHQTVAQRHAIDPSFLVGQRRVIGNFRRLPWWLLSRVFFEVQRRGEIGAPSRDQLVRGMFMQSKSARALPSESNQMRQVLADEQIRPFVSEITDWVRTENLKEDLTRVFGLPVDHAAFNRQSRNKTTLEYVKSLAFWFTPRELALLYDRNPIWAELEKKLYGDVLKL